ESTPWLSLSATSGTTPSSLSLSVNPTGLVVGSYLGTVTIAAAGATGSPQTVTVRFVVTNGEGLVVAPSSLRFTMMAGRPNPAPVGLDILNSGGGAISWSATSSASWLSVSPALGTTPATASASVNGTGLTQGTYRGLITVDAPGAASGSPAIVPVELVVQPGPGASCQPGAWYCERFDTLQEGDIGGQA